MNLQIFIFFFIFTFVTCEYKCSESDCHECIENSCHLTCQGVDCSDCPNGDCCNGENCNACIESICCSTAKCNECVNNNRKICIKGMSSSSCDNLIGNKCGLHGNNELVGSYNTNRHNITTIIKLRNLINTTNVIDAPINLNLTNIDDILANSTGKLGHGSGFRQRQSCCSIIHPQQCHTIIDLPHQICFTRRHRECSSFCTISKNLLIKKDPSGVNRCIVVAAHPYYYCGFYTTEDCSSCYNCKSERKIDCLWKSSCSETCRSSVLPRKFYNVPYFMRTAVTEEESETPPAQ